MFPKKITYKDGYFGTDELSPSFALIKEIKEAKEPWVTPGIRNWNYIYGDLFKLYRGLSLASRDSNFILPLEYGT
jgi:hypothetical protein